MIINGKAIAETVYARLPKQTRSLGIIVGGKNPVIDSFVRIKEKAAHRLGVTLMHEELSEDATTEDAVQAVARLAGKTDGLIVQLPLPSRLDTEKILASIPPEKDVDGISTHPRVRPPVAEAIAEILAQTSTQVLDVQAVVVGSGRLVGKPAAELLKDLGAHVTVIQKGDSLQPVKDADILILGTGEPGLIKPEYIKDGIILIDAGTSEIGGKVKGDADPACAAKAAVFTPVPGGVGPIAVAMIFKNLSELANRVARR